MQRSLVNQGTVEGGPHGQYVPAAGSGDDAVKQVFLRIALKRLPACCYSLTGRDGGELCLNLIGCHAVDQAADQQLTGTVAAALDDQAGYRSGELQLCKNRCSYQ